MRRQNANISQVTSLRNCHTCDISISPDMDILSGCKIPSLISPLCSPVSSPRYFTNISIGGRDYSFNSDGYLSNPLLDVISYTNGRGWEEVSTQLCKLALIIIAQRLDGLTAISQPIKHANSSLLSFTFLLSHCLPHPLLSPRSN